jgi:hypothetical protein
MFPTIALLAFAAATQARDARSPASSRPLALPVRAMLPDRKPGARLPLFALDAPDIVEALGPMRVEVGAWAEYLVRSPQGTARMRFSLLPPKVEGGRYWLEMAAFSDVALPFAMRALLRPGAVVPANMERATLYVLGQAPLEVPMEDLKEHASRKTPGSSGARIVHRAARTLSTQAGRFRATELRITAKGETTRLWRSDEVPLWGLVRSKGPKGAIELVAFSHEGARSAIPGPDQGNGKDSTNQ